MKLTTSACRLTALLLTLAAGTAAAQAWPAKAVRVLVPYAAGGPADIVAREVATRLTEQLGQAFVIENQGGAMGKVALTNVSRAARDGYTLLFAASGNVVIHPLIEKKTDILTHIAPVSLISTSPHVLVVTGKLPIRTVKDLVDYARANPGKVNFGSAGTGGTAHLGMELFKSMAKVDVVHVPYKGTSQATVDLVSGEIQAMFSSMPSLKPLIDKGNIRAVGMSAKSRMATGIPLIGDTIPGFEYTTWYGMYTTAGTPRPVIDKLNAAIRKATSDPALKKKLEVQGLDPEASTPEELAAYMRKESEKWGKVIEEAKITLE